MVLIKRHVTLIARTACICTEQISMLVDCSSLCCVSFVAGESTALHLQELHCCRRAMLLICLCTPAFWFLVSFDTADFVFSCFDDCALACADCRG